MITLVAATVTKLIKAENRDRTFLLTTSSTTGTRIANSPDPLGTSTGGYAFYIYSPIAVDLPAGNEIFAIDAGTPNISLTEIIGKTTNTISLY